MDAPAALHDVLPEVGRNGLLMDKVLELHRLVFKNPRQGPVIYPLTISRKHLWPSSRLVQTWWGFRATWGILQALRCA